MRSEKEKEGVMIFNDGSLSSRVAEDLRLIGWRMGKGKIWKEERKKRGRGLNKLFLYGDLFAYCIFYFFGVLFFFF